MESITKNRYVLDWIKEMAELTRPDRIIWIDGSDEQRDALRAEAVSTGEMIKLNQDLLPGCYLHRTAVNFHLHKNERGRREYQQLDGTR